MTSPHPPATPDLDRLFRHCAPRLARLVGGILIAPTPVVDDACQFAWLRLATQTTVPAEQSLAWLLRTALREGRRLLDQAERDVSLDQLVDPDEERTERLPVAEDPHHAVSEHLRARALACLTRRQQRLIWLQVLGCSHAEMARLSGCTERTVHRQLVRARARLRAAEAASAG